VTSDPANISNPQSILFVDADVLPRQSIAEYLRECGYKVLEAINTDEAIALLNKDGVRIDILLVDALAPGALDGFGLARWTRESRPEIEIVLAGTAIGEAAKAADLCEEGPHLAKPYHPQLLIDRIKRMTKGRADTA
jgi:DNA-binding response OmpR family regulator